MSVHFSTLFVVRGLERKSISMNRRPRSELLFNRILAIMLGRLKMPIADAVKRFEELISSDEVINLLPSGEYNFSIFDKWARDLVRHYTSNEDTLLYEEDSACLT